MTLPGPAVKGCCPMGCGETLFLGSGGYVTCSKIGCPNPGAAAQVLAVKETEHIVLLEETTFRILHPLRERLHDELFECGLHQWLVGLNRPPRRPGRYRVSLLSGGWLWYPLNPSTEGDEPGKDRQL